MFRLCDIRDRKLQHLWECLLQQQPCATVVSNKRFVLFGFWSQLCSLWKGPASEEAKSESWESCLLLVVFLAVLCHCFGWAPGWCQGPVGANWATVSRPLGKHSSWRGPGTKPCRRKGGERGGGGFPFTIACLLFSLHTHCTACQNPM